MDGCVSFGKRDCETIRKFFSKDGDLSKKLSSLWILSKCAGTAYYANPKALTSKPDGRDCDRVGNAGIMNSIELIFLIYNQWIETFISSHKLRFQF